VAKGDNLRVSEKELELGISFALAAKIACKESLRSLCDRAIGIGRVPRQTICQWEIFRFISPCGVYEIRTKDTRLELSVRGKGSADNTDATEWAGSSIDISDNMVTLRPPRESRHEALRVSR
jgi:hypothetical protein